VTSADHFLADTGESAGGGGHGAEAPAAERAFEAPFKSLDDYVLLKAYRKGGEDSFLPGKILRHSRGIFHAPHYAVVEVAPVLKAAGEGQESGGADQSAQGGGSGAATEPQIDPSAEPVTVVMVRDLGNLRQPAAMITLAMGLLFAVLANTLHRRDRQIAAMRAAPASV
jgi:hypothetical protein